MTRASDFRVGQKVKMTPHAEENYLQGRAKSTRGIVVAVKEPQSIKVRRDGLKTASWYHCAFWEDL